MAVIVMGQHQDPHAMHMLEQLKLRGVEAYLLQTYDFPKKAQLSICPNDGTGRLTLPEGKSLELSEIQAVFWRNFSGVSDEATRNNFMSEDSIAAQDSLACLRTWFHLETGTKWVNSWTAFQHHKEKPFQLLKVGRLGVKIPKTYVGNCLEDIRQAFEMLPRSIFKPVYGGAHTEILTEAHLASERVASALAKSPITVQEFIAGTNIRTYVIGQKVFSVELKSDQADFRNDAAMELVLIDTPKEIEEQALSITKTLFLNWTAIDWRRNEQGEYFFLEANPSPMFMGFEQGSGIPVTEYLIDYMLGQSH
ncbi:ATP-grasp domain-containing protein [Pseudoalteromonas xiamenensis]|uniref:ATP-grasp domain-containing protein n=1 Tax=Pseudoalteromonas xiamenensis TaxID=882626 RepID=A0A975DEY5_9GAMM|nr:hypothetical protein [Pseudoalteromonas xiamenensis]QTH70334.1 hypothetical protein J5O05_09915 [Pseudoalteromonas xiamenensis]